MINSLFEIFSESAQFVYLAITASGINFIPFKNAVFFQTHAIIGLSSALFMLYLLSFDRLLAVAFPF